jgi:hypothetical protein
MNVHQHENANCRAAPTMLVRLRDAALRLARGSRSISSLHEFDAALERDDADLPAACAELLARHGVTAQLAGSPIPRDACALVYSRLGGLLDPFLLPLACGDAADANDATDTGDTTEVANVSALHCRAMAHLVGPNYSRRVFSVAACATLPANGAWRGSLLSRGCGWSWRVAERGLPQAEDAERTLERCRSFLRSGGRLCLFPAGVLGDASWGDLLGGLVLDFLRQPSAYRSPLVLCPVDIRGAPQGLALPPLSQRGAQVVVERAVCRPEAVLPLNDLPAATPAMISRLLAVDYDHRFRAAFRRCDP